jgi:acyl-CoA thioesterase I
MAFGTRKNELALFQGDSITDAGRSREDLNDLGRGYPLLAAAWYQSMHPEQEVRFINRGIGGHRAADLLARWQEDCVALKPTLVSILIGINDTWRRYDSNRPTSADDFESSYRGVLEMTRKSTDARILMMEPFVLPCPTDRCAWREDLDPKIQVVRTLAREFDAVLVPLDGLFAQAATRREPEFWAADGVHPTPAGHALIARAWLDAVLRF